eukprot:1732885-Prymnesium_polylepis.1
MTRSPSRSPAAAAWPFGCSAVTVGGSTALPVSWIGSGAKDTPTRSWACALRSSTWVEDAA